MCMGNGLGPAGFVSGSLMGIIFMKLYEPKRRIARHEAFMRPMREEYLKLRRPTGYEEKNSPYY